MLERVHQMDGLCGQLLPALYYLMFQKAAAVAFEWCVCKQRRAGSVVIKTK